MGTVNLCPTVFKRFWCLMEFSHTHTPYCLELQTPNLKILNNTEIQAPNLKTEIQTPNLKTEIQTPNLKTLNIEKNLQNLHFN